MEQTHTDYATCVNCTNQPIVPDSTFEQFLTGSKVVERRGAGES